MVGVLQASSESVLSVQSVEEKLDKMYDAFWSIAL